VALPVTDSLCLEFAQFDGQLCVTFPGGTRVCAQFGYELGDPTEIVKSLIAQVNSALAPLGPFFDMLDCLKKIVDCVQAIPDSLGPPPDPTAIADCLPGLLEAINKLLKLVPPFPIFQLVGEILDVLITFLVGLRGTIQTLILKQGRLLAGATRAAELGNIDLATAIDCAQGNLEVQVQNLNIGLGAINRLVGVVNLLMELAGLGCLPPFGELAAASLDALQPIDDLIAFLQGVRAAIPAPPTLVPKGSKDDC
jgi:hypothetical protein